MIAARPGSVPRIAGQSMVAKRVQGDEREALAGLEPGLGDGVEAGEQDARGEGAIEDDVRGDDAAEAEDRNAEAAEPAAAAPDGEEAEGDDDARG